MTRTCYSLILVCLFIVLPPSVFASEHVTLKPFVEKALKVAGVKKVRSLRAWTLVMKVKDRHEADHSGTRRIFVQLPDRYRSDFECEEASVGDEPIRTSVVVNGQKGWRTVLGETEELSVEDIGEKKARMRFQPDWSRAVALLVDPQYKQALMAEQETAGRATVGIKLTSEKKSPVHLFFDKETNQLLKVEYVQKDGQQAERTYRDYREVGGIQVPHKWTFKTDGNVDYESDAEGVGRIRFQATLRPEDWVYEIIELKFADKLEAKLFDKP